MKKKIVLLSSVTLLTLSMVLGITLKANKVSGSFASSENIDNQPIIINESNRNPVTAHGNTISTTISSPMKIVSGYVCGLSNASSDGYFYTATPIQSINKIVVSWKCTSMYKVIFKVGSSKGGSNVFSENQISIMGSKTATTTINVSNPSEAHYFTIEADKFDVTSSFYLTSVTIYYSCSY